MINKINKTEIQELNMNVNVLPESSITSDEEQEAGTEERPED